MGLSNRLLFMLTSIEPAILYFGTPVVLISTVNEDGTYNIAPMSSAWWLGWAAVLGLGAGSKTTDNLLRERECVLNLPSSDMASYVDRLALTTGSNPVPEKKTARGYRYEPDKFALSGLTPITSERVRSPRAKECPVQLEATLKDYYPVLSTPDGTPACYAIHVQIERVHVEEAILRDGFENHIDPDKWRPLIMSFQQLYGIGERAGYSTLAEIPEEKYRPFSKLR